MRNSNANKNNATIEMPKNKGYKHTSLGWIPKDWGVKKLSNILIEGKLGGNYENSETNDGIPVIKMGNIERGKINIGKIQYLPRNFEFDTDDILKEGDLLFNTRNTLELVGKVAIWKDELPLAVFNSNIMRMRFDKKQVANNWFMNYLLNSFSSLSQLRGFAIGTTSVAAIYGRDLGHLKIPLPPLPEQRRIAALLSTWDEAIAQTQQLIEQLKQRNNGLMQQLLTGKKRLRGFSGKWKKRGAASVFRSISVKGFATEELLSATQDKGIIPRRMLEGRVTMPTTGTEGFKLVEVGDFVISLRSFQGGIEYSYYRGLVSPAYTVLKPRIPINEEFYKQYFKSYDFIGHLAIAVIGIRDGKQISYEDFCTVKIPHPPLEEQTAIAMVFKKATEEVKIFEQKITALKEQKKGLMQVLLTGKKRLNLKC